MKGKGKSIADKDCPLQFPDLQPVDHTIECPKYTAVLSRTDDDSSVGLEEVEGLQVDIETLLAAAGLRLKQLENEKQILINWQDKKDKKIITPGKQQPETPTSGKRGKVVEEKPNKKFKGTTEPAGKGSHPTPVGPGRPKSKVTQQVKGDIELNADSPIELPKLQKNDAVNRFWIAVEPYCADITNEDIKVLEDLLCAHEDDSDYFKVPNLGKHFAEKWAEEDLLEEQRDGSKLSEKRRNNNNNNNTSSGETTTLLKKAEQSNVDESPFGPLTQRLVSALIEENIMTPMDDVMTEITGGKESPDEAPAISPRALAKQLNIGNPMHLEKRIKRELEEQGILDIEECLDDNPDDEILTELRQKQQELKALCQHNIAVTKALLDRAKEEMKKQELRKKISAADSEVLEAYRKIQAAHQKKRTPTKKEKELAFKALKERESFIKQLDSRFK